MVRTGFFFYLAASSKESFKKSVRRRINFTDSLRIFVSGGSGGQGYPSYGGIGGDGGNVYLQPTETQTLRGLKLQYPTKRFKAEGGRNSRRHILHGSKGNNLMIPIPNGVSVYSEENQLLGDLVNLDDRLLVATGGKGGCSSNDWNGQKGEKHVLSLELKILADIGLVGFPNAGKSTLLSTISRLAPKIAEYPFTTIKPQIGTIHYPDLRQITVADLPGLIEGAHFNLGMGHKFLRHVERTHLLLFVVDVNGFKLSSRSFFRNAYETVLLLNKELELYKQHLLDKPAVLAINKLDLPDTENIFEEVKNRLKEGDLTGIPAEMQPKTLIKFSDVIGISAKEGHCIPQLVQCVRQVIDQDPLESDNQNLAGTAPS
ncbi:GTP-binding protein 10-like [Anneissia japonica]|uniref:GTP-binding protein 10-like n=1 Tax=Anneissia japonica TaxID=1529436 RepID=UPI001425B499|nr:GTP-binding protein 10-like [Anneissia japonica]